ncbi:ankyrin repeat-containing domain protein [Chaetomidium leptoderma]|uniref:Ankyrin repeat-containing domain protein n=1 Tax=Chaetomidium leptoderma TaxID=669021 RepID=A0AAN6VPL6_9PEZI|nr:ankyrin repeat-containing domain protein [Chaetomidium leptoderma]
MIQLLVGGITDRDQRKKASSAALSHAAEDPTLTAYLLSAGADVNSGWPLRLACRHGCEEVVRLLLAAGADPNGSDSDDGGQQGPPLSEVPGNLYLIRLLVEAGADVNGFRVMWQAAQLGSVPVLMLLVDAGANVNVEQTSGYALNGTTTGRPSEPLIEASGRGHVGAVRFLLAAGIDLDYVLEDGKTKGEQALEAACYSRREAVALLLMDAGVIKSPKTQVSPGMREGQPWLFTKAMGYAVTHGALAVMTRFLESGSVNPNGLTRDNLSGFTIDSRCFLVEAAERGHAEAVALLLDHGAQVEGVGGTIPLHSAASHGHVGVILALLDRGADVMARSSDEGKTALHFAASANLAYNLHFEDATTHRGDAIQLLLARGAEVDARSNDGLTPLQVAAREGVLGATQVLLEAGADFNVRDEEGWTPAHRAAWNKHREVVVALMMVGVSLDLETNDGLTVTDLLGAKDEDGSSADNSDSGSSSGDDW